MLVAALLWYRKFLGDLETELYIFNPYDPCVANKTVEKKQHTVCFHIDDLMASHVLPKINDRFDTWLNKMYGHCGAVKCNRGKVHYCLGMTLDFTIKGTVKFQMLDYVANMFEDFSVDNMSQLILWTDHFMDAQGYPIKENILYQDNKSMILLLNNGKQSSAKHTHAINIRYFFLTDQIQKGKLQVAYCPTG